MSEIEKGEWRRTVSRQLTRDELVKLLTGDASVEHATLEVQECGVDMPRTIVIGLDAASATVTWTEAKDDPRPLRDGSATFPSKRRAQA